MQVMVCFLAPRTLGVAGVIGTGVTFTDGMLGVAGGVGVTFTEGTLAAFSFKITESGK